MVRDAVEDARPSLPLPMRSLAVVECSFGSAHPQFGPILAGSRSHRHVKEHGHDGLEVQLDIGLKYSTDANIKLQLGVMPFGISHIEVNGVLSLRFTPLLDEMPVFSAMQLFFLTPPQVSIRFSDMLEVANTPFIMQQIRAAIDHAIHDRLVLPNALGINWADPGNDETVTWPTVLPSYVVRVSVHRASDLCSSSTMRTRGPDAYAVVSVGGRRVRTRTVSGKSLTWAESFDFVIYDTRQHFQVEVFDVDFAGKSWPIGKTKESQVEHAAAGSSSGQWWALEGAPAGAAGHRPPRR
ncbi:unnamed protein product [Prorocentrum cordatum]|uniref:C2 domain-containing protein n=1 Tax=Prorocentrum cordatum TaxID=2364126 RepID=A0ABN9PSZ4_9DINO|nr:unnamed protein product [Polarella glacialis]